MAFLLFLFQITGCYKISQSCTKRLTKFLFNFMLICHARSSKLLAKCTNLHYLYLPLGSDCSFFNVILVVDWRVYDVYAHLPPPFTETINCHCSSAVDLVELVAKAEQMFRSCIKSCDTFKCVTALDSHVMCHAWPPAGEAEIL